MRRDRYFIFMQFCFCFVLRYWEVWRAYSALFCSCERVSVVRGDSRDATYRIHERNRRSRTSLCDFFNSSSILGLDVILLLLLENLTIIAIKHGSTSSEPLEPLPSRSALLPLPDVFLLGPRLIANDFGVLFRPSSPPLSAFLLCRFIRRFSLPSPA